MCWAARSATNENRPPPHAVEGGWLGVEGRGRGRLVGGWMGVFFAVGVN